jgi:hypothetical protein
MIRDGIYKVAFTSNIGASGIGLAVIDSGMINGGDFGYLYQGQIAAHGSDLTANLNISQYNREAQSVFGPLGDFGLELTGSLVSATSFNVQGAVARQPNLRITIDGIWLKPLAGSHT